MTLNSTRERLSYLLSNDDVKVIALTGKWGTGKSHMWTTLEGSSSEERVKNALYVSLFGLTSIDGIKSKLVQNAAPSLERNKALLKSTKAIYGGAVKVLEGFHKGFAALNGIGEIAMLVAPAVLLERLIVLDDIERKHDQLNIEENGPDAEYVLTFGRDSDDFDYDDAPPTVEAAEPVKPNPLYGKNGRICSGPSGSTFQTNTRSSSQSRSSLGSTTRPKWPTCWTSLRPKRTWRARAICSITSCNSPTGNIASATRRY